MQAYSWNDIGSVEVKFIPPEHGVSAVRTAYVILKALVLFNEGINNVIYG